MYLTFALYLLPPIVKNSNKRARVRTSEYKQEADNKKVRNTIKKKNSFFKLSL